MNGRNGSPPDLIHPSDLGHKMMSDLAVFLFQSTIIDLLIRPLDDEERMLLRDDIPAPMYKGNDVPTNVPMCLQFDKLKTIILNSSGFSFIEEGPKKKKGFVATQPGSWILFKVNTVRDQPGPVLVQLGHLRSYAHMGIADANCESGCKCSPKIIDGYHSHKVSQTYLAGLEVSQHEACLLKLTVSVRTNSPANETKFKITGVMLSDTANPSRKHGFMNEQEFGAMSTN